LIDAVIRAARFLMRVGGVRILRRLRGEHEHRRRIRVRARDAGQRVRRARSLREHDADAAARLRIRGRGKCGGALVPARQVPDAGLVERVE
jgi:hypothetical protein